MSNSLIQLKFKSGWSRMIGNEPNRVQAFGTCIDHCSTGHYLNRGTSAKINRRKRLGLQIVIGWSVIVYFESFNILVSITY